MKEVQKENKLIKNSDFLICSVLLYFDHILEGISRSNTSRCIFIIKRKDNTNEILDKFYRGLLLVEPKRFQSIQKEIKSRLYN